MQTVNLKALLKDRGIRLSELANRLGVHKANATRWAKYEVPLKRVVEIESVTGIPRHELRPDAWPKGQSA